MSPADARREGSPAAARAARGSPPGHGRCRADHARSGRQSRQRAQVSARAPAVTPDSGGRSFEHEILLGALARPFPPARQSRPIVRFTLRVLVSSSVATASPATSAVLACSNPFLFLLCSPNIAKMFSWPKAHTALRHSTGLARKTARADFPFSSI